MTTTSPTPQDGSTEASQFDDRNPRTAHLSSTTAEQSVGGGAGTGSPTLPAVSAQPLPQTPFLIPSFGLYWDRENLVKAPSNAASADLLGYAYSDYYFEKQHGLQRIRKQKVSPDPYPPLIDHTEQDGVYALYDEGFRLLYVGEGQLGKRLLGHHQFRNKAYTDSFFKVWRWFSWFGLYKCSDADVAHWYTEWDSAKAQGAFGRLYNCGYKRVAVDKTIGWAGASQKVVQQALEALLLTVAEPPRNRQGPKWAPKKSAHPSVEYLQAKLVDLSGYVAGHQNATDPKQVTDAKHIVHAGTYWLGPRSEVVGRWGSNPNDVLGVAGAATP